MTLPALPAAAYTAFLGAFLTALLLVVTQHWHGRYSMDGLAGVQKMHVKPTPRVGGIAIFVGAVIGWWFTHPNHADLVGMLLIAGVPAFLFGLAEDLTKVVGVGARLMATMASGVLGWWLTGVSLTHVGVAGVDGLLQWSLLSVAFTAFAVGGIANAVNIIDGFNGLASGFVVIALAGITSMALAVNDRSLALACMVIGAAVIGFWLINWPWGKLFLGDGGSYFAGFALAWASVLLVERHEQIAAFAVALMCVHPITEVLFSIYRRALRNDHPGRPDRLHLHSLLMRRMVTPGLLRIGVIDAQSRKRLRNPATGLVLALMSVPPVFLAYGLRHDQWLSALAMLGFILGYVSLYARLVRFRWCSPLDFLFVRPTRAGARRSA